LPAPIDRTPSRAFFVFRQSNRNGFIATSRWNNCSSIERMIVLGRLKVKAPSARFVGALRRAVKPMGKQEA
jgi:hypothetical protein